MWFASREIFCLCKKEDGQPQSVESLVPVDGQLPLVGCVFPLQVESSCSSFSTLPFAAQFRDEFVTVAAIERFDMFKGASIRVIGDAVHNEQRGSRLDVQ